MIAFTPPAISEHVDTTSKYRATFLRVTANVVTLFLFMEEQDNFSIVLANTLRFRSEYDNMSVIAKGRR